MSSGPSTPNTHTGVGNLRIESSVSTAPGVQLSDTQRTLVGSVLDLFAGRPSLPKLRLWEDSAVFADPITNATGRKQYEAQWYGLQKVFSEIQRLNQSVTSAGNPIQMDLTTKYTVKGINKEQTIESKVFIHWDETSKKITKVEDKWNGEIPEGAFRNAFRQINSVTVPALVHVPKNDEEDAKLGNQ